MAWLALGSAAAVAATPPIVAVIEPAGADPVMAEAASRLDAELAAAGMRARVVPCAAGFDPGCAAPADPGDAPNATVAIRRAGDRAAAIEVKVKNAPGGDALVRRIDIGPEGGGDDPSVLAVRAIELLLATQMQPASAGSTAPAASAPPAPAAAVARPAPAPVVVTRSSASWGIAAGAALLQSFDGFGSAFGPEARVAFRPRGAIGVEARAAALELAPDLKATAGTASLQQELGVLAVTWAPPIRSRRLVPTLSVGAGVYHVQVSGHASAPAHPLTRTLWAPALDVGLGVVARLSARYALRFDAAALFLEPSPYVTIGGDSSFHAGRPLLSLGLAFEIDLPDVWRELFQ